MTDIVILAGARTPIGSFGGALSTLAPIETATHVTRAAMERAGVTPDQIGTVVFGHVLNTEPRDMYLSRVAAMQAGIPETVPAMNVNRLCGSGAQAVVSAVQALLLGDADFALAGGAEAMSRAPYILPAARFGQKMGDARALDMMIGALRDPAMALDLHHRPLFEDRPTILARRGHPLETGWDADALRRFPWILPPDGTPLRHLWRAMFAELGGVLPAVPIECGSVMTVRQLLVAGDYLTLLSHDQLALELQAGMLTDIGPAPGAISRTIGLTTRADWRPTRLQQQFMDAVAIAAGTMNS